MKTTETKPLQKCEAKTRKKAWDNPLAAMAQCENRATALVEGRHVCGAALLDDLAASAATAELYRTAAEQAAKERDEALRERDLVGQSFERAGAELLRIEAERDEARALAKDAQDTRDRLAVEVQALRGALGDLLTVVTTDPGPRPTVDAVIAAKRSLSAPSEFERVLAARDERTRAEERAKCENGITILKALLGGASDLPLADALAKHDRDVTEALRSELQDAVFAATNGHMQGCKCSWCGRLAEFLHPSEGGALAATPPSAASGKPCRRCAFEGDDPKQCETTPCDCSCHRAASGKGET